MIDPTGEVVIKPSKVATGVLLGFGLGSVGMGVWFAQQRGVPFIFYAAFLCLAGAAMLFAGAQLLVPGRAYLRVNEAGITCKRGSLVETYAWHDIESFCIAPEGRNAWAVGLRFRPGHPRRGSPNAQADVTLGTVWQLEPNELKALLEERHRRMLTASHQAPPR